MEGVSRLLEDVRWPALVRRLALFLAAAQGLGAALGLTRDVRRERRRRARRKASRRDRRRDAATSRASEARAGVSARGGASSPAARSRASSSPRSPGRFVGGPGDALPDDAAREEELAAAALDEVAMALAMEGKTGASEAVANMALKVARATLPPPRAAAAASAVNRPVGAAFPSAGLGAGLSAPGSSAYQSPALSGSPPPDRSSAASSAGASPDPDAFADAAFDMATRAAAMGDEPDAGFTDDDEAEGVEALRAARRANAEERARRRREAEARESLATPPGGSGDDMDDPDSDDPDERDSDDPDFVSADERDSFAGDEETRGDSSSPDVFARVGSARPEGDAPPTPASFGRRRRDGFRYDDEYDANEDEYQYDANEADSPGSPRGPGRSEGTPRPRGGTVEGPAGGRTQAPPTLRVSVCSGSAWGSAASATPGAGDACMTVGRAATRDLVVSDDEVSASHAEIRWTWFGDFLDEEDAGASRGARPLGEWRLADVGSTNGTFLNGDAIGGGGRGRAGDARALRDGDEIRLGERGESPRLRVAFTYEATVPAAFSPAAFSTDSDGALRSRSSHSSLSPLASVTSGACMSPGRSSRPTEDRAVVECPLRGFRDVALFCVFDGHAGAGAADRAAALFPSLVAKRLGGRTPRADARANNGAFEALRGAFLDADAAIARDVDGCAAAAVLVWRCPATGLAFAQAANVGDCRVALGRVGVDVAGRRADTARFLTEAHVVETNARERERLERDHGIAVAPGTVRVGGMRTTRALGDALLKRAPGTAFLVAEPHVSSPVELAGDGADAIVLASDGVWDVVEDAAEATAIVAEEANGAGAGGGGGRGEGRRGRRRRARVGAGGGGGAAGQGREETPVEG
jgi:serine/threonine protein phosphatase PrpC